MLEVLLAKEHKTGRGFKAKLLSTSGLCDYAGTRSKNRRCYTTPLSVLVTAGYPSVTFTTQFCYLARVCIKY